MEKLLIVHYDGAVRVLATVEWAYDSPRVTPSGENILVLTPDEFIDMFRK